MFFEMSLKPWDYAAGALLVTEAGGSFDMPLSKSGVDFSKNTAIFATNGICCEEARSLFDENCAMC